MNPNEPPSRKEGIEQIAQAIDAENQSRDNLSHRLDQERLESSRRKVAIEKFQEKIEEITGGTVIAVEREGLIVNTPYGHAYLANDQMIPGETILASDHIQALISGTRPLEQGPPGVLTRSSPVFLIRFLEKMIPGINEKKVQIHAIARDPGVRSKIAVSTQSSKVDPVGACIGMRGSRIQAVVDEMNDERMDIIRWAPQPKDYIANALEPGKVNRVLLDQNQNQATAILTDRGTNLHKTIGKRGQNVRLAVLLTGWKITVLTEEQFAEKQAQGEYSQSQNKETLT